jgi:hypothetical protein
MMPPTPNMERQMTKIFVITVDVNDVDNLRDVLAEAAAEGQIEYPFDFKEVPVLNPNTGEQA